MRMSLVRGIRKPVVITRMPLPAFAVGTTVYCCVLHLLARFIPDYYLRATETVTYAEPLNNAAARRWKDRYGRAKVRARGNAAGRGTPDPGDDLHRQGSAYGTRRALPLDR